VADDNVFTNLMAARNLRAAVEACAPGGCVVLAGGCAAGSDASLPTHPLHYDERLATAGYYQGLASVRRIGLLPETERYVENVFALRGRFGG